MQTERARAVIACLDDAGARRFSGLLAEAGYEAAAAVRSVPEVIPALREHRPRLLLAEAVLPGGDGVSLAQAVTSAALNRYPCILLTKPVGLLLPGSASLSDYGAALLDSPLTVEALASAASALEDRATRLPPAQGARLEALLTRLGVPRHPGRALLTNAAALVWRDRERLKNLRDDVYPDAARPLGKTGAQAERAIRHVIEAAWRTGEIDEQQRIFGDTIDARRGRPTCSEMIAQLADILRWEG